MKNHIAVEAKTLSAKARPKPESPVAGTLLHGTMPGVTPDKAPEVETAEDLLAQIRRSYDLNSSLMLILGYAERRRMMTEELSCLHADKAMAGGGETADGPNNQMPKLLMETR